MVAIAAEQVYSILEVVEDPKAALRATMADPEWIESASRVLASRKIELMFRPSKSPGVAGNPGASPKQIEFREAVLASETGPEPIGGIYAIGGSNRAGKTVGGWGTGAEMIRDHLKNGDLIWCVAPDFTKLKTGPHKWLWEFLPRWMFRGRVWTEKLGFGTNPNLELYLPEGRGKVMVVFKTEEQDITSFESDSVRLILWTEATREALYDSMISRLVDTAGCFIIDYLPTEAWHVTRLQNHLDVMHWHVCMKENAHNLPAGAIEAARRKMTPDQAALRIDGKNRAAEGVVIKEFRNVPFVEGDEESGHTLTPGSFAFDAETDPAWVYTDVGKYTASLLITVTEEGRWVVVDEAYTIGDNIASNVEAVDKMIERHGMTREQVRGWKMDPAADAYTAANEVTVMEQYRRLGLPYVDWARTATIGEVAMLEKMRMAFKEWQILVVDRCINLINELTTWKHRTDRDHKITPGEQYVGANHAIDGLKAFVHDAPSRVETFSMPLDTAEY